MLFRGGGMKNMIGLKDGYALMFREYPDVVDIPAMREMLGGVGRRAAYALLQSGEIKSVKIGRVYRIPKLGIIAYLCGCSCQENSLVMLKKNIGKLRV